MNSGEALRLILLREGWAPEDLSIRLTHPITDLDDGWPQSDSSLRLTLYVYDPTCEAYVWNEMANAWSRKIRLSRMPSYDESLEEFLREQGFDPVAFVYTKKGVR